jgi:hypothetical protein
MRRNIQMYTPDSDQEGSAKGPNHTGKSHAGESNDEKRNVPEDGPSGENTENDGEHGGGLWTSGGQVTSGTPYNDDYGTPKSDYDATPQEDENE